MPEALSVMAYPGPQQSSSGNRPLMLMGALIIEDTPRLHTRDLLHTTSTTMLEVKPAYGGGERVTRTAKYRAIWRGVYSCRRSCHTYLLTCTNGQSLIRID